MSYINHIGTISSFQRRECDVFYWKIEKFSTLSEKTAENCYYCCPDFVYKDIYSYLKFYPNGASGKSGCIGLTFVSRNHKGSSRVHLKLGLKTRSGGIVKWFSSFIFYPEKNEIGSPALIQRSEILKRKEQLVPSDCLTFAVLLGPDKVKIIRGVGDRTETGHEEEKDEKQSEKKGGEKVLGDMAKLLTSGDKSDAMIVVGEAEYKVHSCILSARTPVFAALFEHDTLEKATRKITITDCEPAILKGFLNYIYTGNVQDLTTENALDLYRVADKYLVKDLKEVCRECIVDNLSTETFCEAVQLAQRYGDNDLLDPAIDYFSANAKFIVNSVEWQRYIEENPREANEILIKLYGPL